jgi:hypothetical protein
MIRRSRIVLSLLVIPAVLAAQARPNVAPDERVYRDIDRLAAAGLIDTLIVGARPFSEREVVRLLEEARRNVERNPAARDWATRTIDADLLQWKPRPNREVDAVRLEGTRLASPFRAIPADPNGFVPAIVNPLAADREDRPIVNGTSMIVETAHSLSLDSHLAIALNPRLSLTSPSIGGSTTHIAVQTASANLLFGNLAIEAGRDYAIFGQAPNGGLLLSENAPPLDMVRVSNDRPAALPWVFRALGPLRGTLFVADLGTNGEVHPHSKLVAYHVAALPTPHLEVGLEVIDAMGGNGGNPASFGDRVLDVVPIFDVFRSHSDFQFSNKMAGVDFHWREPSWSGFELYGQTAVDDFDARRLKSVLLEDGGYVLGTALSCLAECGRFGVRAEYRQTGIRYYTHYDYPIAERGLILGDQLGPRGLGAYLTLDGESRSGEYLALQSAFEVRSGNGYGSATTNGTLGSAGFRFVQASHGPAEKRGRLVLTSELPLTHDPHARLTLRTSAGVERVSNYAFNGSDRTNWLLDIAVLVRP